MTASDRGVEYDFAAAARDKSSSSNPGINMEQNYISPSRRMVKNIARTKLKNLKMQAYKMKFEKYVEARLESEECACFQGRDFTNIRDSFLDSKAHVAEYNYPMCSEYVWICHPQTHTRIRDTYDFNARVGISADFRVGSPMEVIGHKFMQSKVVPKGWLLLMYKGTEDAIDSLRKPFALVKGIDEGFRNDIRLSCGGEMSLWVIDK